jgi:hypothetical protein
MTAYVRPLSEDDRALVTHITMWGSDGYPIRKVGSRWDWSYRSLSAPILYRTKRDAVAAFETYMGVLRDCLASEAQGRATLCQENAR